MLCWSRVGARVPWAEASRLGRSLPYMGGREIVGSSRVTDFFPPRSTRNPSAQRQNRQMLQHLPRIVGGFIPLRNLPRHPCAHWGVRVTCPRPKAPVRPHGNWRLTGDQGTRAPTRQLATTNWRRPTGDRTRAFAPPPHTAFALPTARLCNHKIARMSRSGVMRTAGHSPTCSAVSATRAA